MSESLIPRQTPEITIRVSEDEEYGLTYDNTIMCEFAHGYDFMNHVYVKHESEMGFSALYLFGQEQLVTALKEYEYPLRVDPYPSDGDIEAYMQHQERMLEQELEGDDD